MQQMQPLAVVKRAVPFVLAPVAYTLKRFVPFVFFLAIGYTLGYKDAYRGPSSVGWMLGDLVDRMRPDAIRDARANNAAAIRQKQRQGLPAIFQD
jgi:hypothetical protein